MKDLQDKIDSFDSKKICAIIITSKYFGNNEDTIRMCMMKLADRRAAGEEFNFENYIKEEFDKLPQPTAKSFNIQDLAGSFGKFL